MPHVFSSPLHPFSRRTAVRSSGFTLVEILIALSLLGLLTVMLFTSFYSITRSWEADTKPTQISANKILYPLSKRGVRLNAGIENSANKAEEELINKSSLIMEIGEEELTYIDGTKYNTLILKPYKSELIEVVQLPGTTDDDEALSVQQANRYITVDGVTRFYLSYKYRTLKTAATNDAPAEWNSWIEVYENMKVPTDD